MQNPTKHYASVWLRALAFAIDFAFISFFLYWLDKFYFYAIAVFFKEQHVNLATDNGMFALGVWGNLVMHFIVWIGYFVAFECSRCKATPGKMIVKAQIACNEEYPVTFSIVLLRNVYKLLPIALFQCIGIAAVITKHSEYGSSSNFMEQATLDIRHNLGFKIASIITFLFIIFSYSLMLLTKRKQALHDWMASTIVVKTDDNPLKQLYLRTENFIRYLRKADFTDK